MATTITSVMPRITVGVLRPAGSSITDEISWTTASFCISSSKSWSMPHSKNSHSTPMVMEKQKATMDIKAGDRERENRSFRLSRSTREKPMAAHRKPLRVWSMVSQPLKMV